jgi:hypothetical protein
MWDRPSMALPSPWVLLELCEIPKEDSTLYSLISRTGGRSLPHPPRHSCFTYQSLHMSMCLRHPHGRHPMQWLLIPHQLIWPEQSMCTCELEASRSLWLPQCRPVPVVAKGGEDLHPGGSEAGDHLCGPPEGLLQRPLLAATIPRSRLLLQSRARIF